MTVQEFLSYNDCNTAFRIYSDGKMVGEEFFDTRSAIEAYGERRIVEWRAAFEYNGFPSTMIEIVV